MLKPPDEDRLVGLPQSTAHAIIHAPCSFDTCLRVALVLSVSLAAMAGCGERPDSSAGASPPTVQVAPVIQKGVPLYREYVGQTESPQTVEIRARVEGFLEKINFGDGTEVKEGQLLFAIDPRQYKASYEKAKAQLNRDVAGLTKARQDAARFRSLHAKDAVSTTQLERAIAREQEQAAQVSADRQAVEEAKLQLEYTTIYAPLSGRIGRSQVKIGSLVGRGEPTLLATISKIDPIWVNASISEREYLEAISHHGQPDTESGAPARRIPVKMILADETVYPHEGRINFVDRTVDTKTGTLPIRVEFPNPDRTLRPGQFARLQAEVDRRENALLVSQKAVQEIQGLHRVVTVGQDGVAHFRMVKLGPRIGDLWVVEEGLQAGDQVVVEGLPKVRDGMTVQAVQAPSAAEPASPTSRLPSVQGG